MLLELSRLRAASTRRMALAVAFLLTLGGCASGVTPGMQRLPDRVELNSVPFFRGDAYQSGPGTLASMLSQQGVIITPGLLEKPLKLPGGEAGLEQNLQNLAREYGFVVYPLDAQLDALLTQVAAGYPVMVRFTDGHAWWAQPRYGVLTGYNRTKQTVVLRAGMSSHLVVKFSDFTSAWKDAGSWAVLIQGPRQLPAQVDSQRWLNAANALAQVGQEQAAGEATKALKAR